MSMASLVFEGLVVVVLLLAAALAWRIDRKLTALRSGADGMAAAVGQLAEASARAQASITALRAASEEAGADLEARVRHASALAGELQRLVEPAPAAAPSPTLRPDPDAGAAPRVRDLLQAARTAR